ncbi:MAG: hypothetical protein C4293_22595 [Nitrospiraceae bacterium]
MLIHLIAGTVGTVVLVACVAMLRSGSKWLVGVLENSPGMKGEAGAIPDRPRIYEERAYGRSGR